MNGPVFCSSVTSWALEVRHPQSGWTTVTTSAHANYDTQDALFFSLWEFVNTALLDQLTPDKRLNVPVLRNPDERALDFFDIGRPDLIDNRMPVHLMFGTDQSSSYQLHTHRRQRTERFLQRVALYQEKNGHAPLLDSTVSLYALFRSPKNALHSRHSAHEILARHVHLEECGGLRPDNVRLLCRPLVDFSLPL